ncbi:MAG: dTDP-glucose 4,6-dehydratase [Proteobacteria bacterium]|nr:dTDP-glucose 4,6-dehydratase [Pseudomonadota bacterium]
MYVLLLSALFLTVGSLGFAAERPYDGEYASSSPIEETLRQYDTILVTGGAGFIGANFVENWVQSGYGKVVNLDSLTYAGSLENLKAIANNPNHIFKRGDICDVELLDEIFEEYKPKAVVHFAAESHVDRSIEVPAVFIESNVYGSFILLESARKYKDKYKPELFKFIHISTDEVYGSLELGEPAFTETTPYHPTTPYSATKAASDMLANAWAHTYNMPVMITHCSNNYGPYQYPEKLIPKVIGHALRGEVIPVYGNGQNIRDWLHVEDHCRAIQTVLANGKIGEVYNIGGNNEKTNLDVIRRICTIADQCCPITKAFKHPITGEDVTSYHDLVTFTKGRLYDDKRYAIDSSKLQRLGWYPIYTFEEGIDIVTRWYLSQPQSF